MSTPNILSRPTLAKLKPKPDMLRPIMRPLPLFIVQPILERIVDHICEKRPELFNRIGPHKDKLFLIEPTNLPFAMVLKPHPLYPSLKAYRSKDIPETHARISGTLMTLLDMVDGRLDGDALFFSRDLKVEGDTEAIVCLRNAMDDMDGSIIEDTADIFGPIGRRTLKILRKIRES